MKHIIVTEPNHKRDIMFAFNHFAKQGMTPKMIPAEKAGISTANNKNGHNLYVVVRPIRADESGDFADLSSTRRRGAVIEL
jgi:hypothetical protein